MEEAEKAGLNPRWVRMGWRCSCQKGILTKRFEAKKEQFKKKIGQAPSKFV